jgi:subtilisin family serine protease
MRANAKLTLVLGTVVLVGACQDRFTIVEPEPDGELGPEVVALLARAAQARVPVIVQLSSRDHAATVAQQAQAQGGSILREYRRFPLLALEVNENALQGLLRSAHVISVTPAVASPPALNTSLGVINADQVHALGWDGSGTTVAILDTGIEAGHDFFSGRVVEEACFSNDGAGQQTLCPNGTTEQTGAGSASIAVTPCQDGTSNICDHGTHVAGIAAGDGTGVATAPAAGVAPAASIIGIQVFTRFDNASDCSPRPAPCVLTWDFNQIAALELVLDLAASYDIVAANMSLGGGEFSTPCDGDPRKLAIDDLRAANIATVISSGNDGFTNAVGAPSCISTAITVGNTQNDDTIRPSSNRGPLLDLFAPGTNIRSAVANNTFDLKTGTSMAAPHVAGAWAVLRQAAPTMTVAQVLTLLQNTGVPITYMSGGSTITTPRIDLAAALAGTTNPPVLTVANASITVDEGSTALNTGTFSDPDGDPVTLSASIGTVVATGPDSWAWSFETTDGPRDSQTVTITGTDDKGATGSIDFELVVENVAPIVDAGLDATIVSGEEFTFSGSFSDPGVDDAPWDWVIDWGDGTTIDGSTNDQALPIVATHQFCAAMEYTIELSVTDRDDDTGDDTMVLTVEHFDIEISIMPDGDPNSISLSRRGRLPVAVLSSPDFDATDLDPASLLLGATAGSGVPVASRPNGTLYATIEDINGDGLPDLLLHFEIPALVDSGDLTEATMELVLSGFLQDGCTNVAGSAPVRVVP